jgi:hypothetical protein
MQAALMLVGTLIAGCTVAPGADDPASSASAATAPGGSAGANASATEPMSLHAEADGYTLDVTADRTSLKPGETVNLAATFTNGTTSPIDYSGSPCSAISGNTKVALPAEPEGRSWTGIRQAFKTYALTNGFGPGGVPALDPVSIPMETPACDGPWESELAGGDSVSRPLRWTADIVPGIGALPGKVPFTIAVGYDRQNGPPSYPPDYQGIRGSWFPMYKQLTLQGTFQVVGNGKPVISAGQAVDAVLGDRTFSRWLAQRPARTWSNANLFLGSSPKAERIIPKGPWWDVELFREVGVPRNWAIAYVDPFDAHIISVNYCDIPCDR